MSLVSIVWWSLSLRWQRALFGSKVFVFWICLNGPQSAIGNFQNLGRIQLKVFDHCMDSGPQKQARIFPRRIGTNRCVADNTRMAFQPSMTNSNPCQRHSGTRRRKRRRQRNVDSQYQGSSIRGLKDSIVRGIVRRDLPCGPLQRGILEVRLQMFGSTILSWWWWPYWSCNGISCSWLTRSSTRILVSSWRCCCCIVRPREHSWFFHFFFFCARSFDFVRARGLFFILRTSHFSRWHVSWCIVIKSSGRIKSYVNSIL